MKITPEPSSSGGGGSPSGAAGGDLAGTYPNPSLGAVVNGAKMAGWTVNAQTGTTYTLVLADAFKILTLNNASAVTLTIPTNASVAFPVGTEVICTGIGAGLVTVAAAGGVTINNPANASLVLARYVVFRLVKIATDTWEVNKGSRPPDGSTLAVNASGQLGVPTGGITSTEILDGTVANGDLASMAAKTVKMRHTNSTGAPEDTSMANLWADLSASAAVTPSDGWVDDTAETWTYASGSGGGVATFTVSGDVTAKYTVGTRIKLTQTTVKYFIVSAAPSFSGGNTTVTITAGSAFTLANAAISANFHSYAANPQGYPGWFNFAPAFTGFASKTQDLLRFVVSGRTCFVQYFGEGTSNATTMGFTLPIPVGANALTGRLLVRVTDAGTVSPSPGSLDITPGNTTAQIDLNLQGGAFTNSGTKGSLGYFTYEI